MKDTLDIGTRRELFVDEYLIEEMNGVRLELQKPARGEVVFQIERPWEDNVAGFNSVVQEGDSVRLYYRASIPRLEDEDFTIIALAESTDGGRSFTRPNLGLVEFQGSRDNNILWLGGVPCVPPAFLDTNPDAKPDQRYKGLCAAWQKLYAMCSADGVRWRPMQQEPLAIDGTFDTVNTAFWDSLAGCYRSFTRYFENWQEGAVGQDVLGPNPTVVRAIQSSTSPDFIHWTPVVPHQYEDGVQETQLYTNATVPCPGAEHIYVAFPNRYVQERIARPDHPYPGVNDALFMTSRDCVHWKRYLEAWVRPGLDPLNWTERNNYPTWGIVLSSETEWSVFVSEHYRHARELPRIRRLSIRPWGFVSVHAGYGGGDFVTRAVLFGGSQLRLNYSTSAVGSVQVEVQDERGKPLDGLALADMEPLFGDELDRAISWKNGSDLSAIAGRPVRLRFVLRDADVFSLRTVLAQEAGK